jgi:hypothetical protein
MEIPVTPSWPVAIVGVGGHIRARRSLLTAASTVLIVVGRGHTSPPPAHPASRSGRTVILRPSEACFDIPTDWIAWYGKIHNNLRLSEKELALVKIGAGEWDTEYAKVANSAMRFQDCVARVGGEDWGKGGSSFGDVQLRVYLTPLRKEKVHQSVSAQGFGAAQRINPNASLLPNVKDGSWHGNEPLLSTKFFTTTNGGTARIDFYTRTGQGQTFVLVFMYCDIDRFGASEEVKSILRSFRLSVPQSGGQ